MDRPLKTRRVKLIKPRLQLRLIGAFAGLCSLAILVQTLVLGAFLIVYANTLPSGGARIAQALPTVLGQTLLVSLLILLPSLLVIGIRITFRIAGPLFRFEQYLSEVVRGEEPGPCRLRRTDDLQNFCALLNAALESARARGEAAARFAEREDRRAAG